MKALLFLVGVLALIAMVTPSTSASELQRVAEQKETPPPTPAIGEDVSEEYFKYILREVHFDCQEQIKRLVKYDIRAPGVLWGTNQGDSVFLRFTRWSARVASDGTIRLYGDNAEAQNGFGNWVRINYSCTVNVATKSVRRATLDQGRLGS
jgi:hypothetical protein